MKIKIRNLCSLCLVGFEKLLSEVYTMQRAEEETFGNGHGKNQTSLKWYSTIAVLSGTLAPAGTFLKNNDKICPAD